MNHPPKALVTGATRGIGRAIAARLLRNGWSVVGTGTSESEKRCANIEELAGVRWFDVNMADSGSVQKFLSEMESVGPFSGLVNNAGVNRIKPLSDVSGEDYDFVHQINLRAPYFISQSLIPGMISLGGGRIVNIASIWSAITKARRSLYSSAKTGLIGQTRALAVEFGRQDILVNLVSPGFVLTDLTRQSLSEEELKSFESQIPTGRMAQPDEIAEVVAFLLGPDNRYLTGQNIIVDGGFSII